MNKNIKQIMTSFALEGKITEVHAQEIETTLTEALKERDELLEEVISNRIMACELLIEEYEKGDDLDSGEDVSFLLNHEFSVKVAMESLKNELLDKKE